MAFRKIDDRWRYQHCSEIGVKADYIILQFKFREGGWRTVGTAHPSCVDIFRQDGVKAHAELVRFSHA